MNLAGGTVRVLVGLFHLVAVALSVPLDARLTAVCFGIYLVAHGIELIVVKGEK